MNTYTITKPIDALLNQVTMYKSVLYALRGLLVTGGILALLNVVSFSALALLISAGTLVLACWTTNWVLAKAFNVPYNHDSGIITGLILACIITPKLTVWYLLLVALTGAIAMATKYLIKWQGSHILNPAAAAAFIVSVTGLLPVSWWVATPWMAPFTVLAALFILRKQRKFTVFVVFAGTALLTMLAVNGANGQAISEVLRTGLLSWPIIFLGSIMLTEPITLPAGRYNQLLVALSVGAAFSAQQSIGPFTSTPQLALLLGNLVAFALAPSISAKLKFKKSEQLAPDITELTFEKPRGLRFTAGQYMEWTLPVSKSDRRGNRRSFSLASAPSDKDLIIAVRTYSKGSAFKTALVAMRPGQVIRAANLSGEFELPAGKSPLLFIAGGVGITPFRSMIAELMAAKAQRDIVLIHVASSKQHFIYAELFKWAAALGLKTEYVLGRRLSAPDLQAMVPDIKKRRVLISGPDAMVSYYDSQLRGIGITKISKDHFSGY